MEAYKILFYLGASLCVISFFMFSGLELKKVVRPKFYASIFKELDASEMRKVKISSLMLLTGISIIIIGAAVREFL